MTARAPFVIGKYEVTFGQWGACVADRGCGGYRPGDESWGRSNRPVINVSWKDAQGYVRWLSLRTGQAYGLPSEAQWEYAARAKTTSKYWWGPSIGSNLANCSNCGSQWDGRQTAPVGSFNPNAFGLYDVHGNVFELVEDCWHETYRKAPKDGSAWATGSCTKTVLRGGSWRYKDRAARVSFRGPHIQDSRSDFGFRVARIILQ